VSDGARTTHIRFEVVLLLLIEERRAPASLSWQSRDLIIAAHLGIDCLLAVVVERSKSDRARLKKKQLS
jgi:hypothetical protein